MRQNRIPEHPLARSIFVAFDRHSIRYFEGLFSDLRSSSPEVRKKAFLTAYSEQQFLLRRAIDPGFSRFVTNHMHTTVQKYRRTLLFAILKSLLGLTVSINDFVAQIQDRKRTAETGAGTKYDRRQIQRLFHEYFVEIVFETEGNFGSPDKRVKSFSTIFAPHIMPTVPTSGEAKAYYTLDKARLWQNDKALTALFYHSILEWMFPEVISDFLEFRKELQHALDLIDPYAKCGEEAKSTILSFDVSAIFHRHLHSLLALEWFRSRQKQVRKRIVSKNYPLVYNKDDSTKAMALLDSVPELGARRYQLAMTAGCSFNFFGSNSGSLLMYDECLRLPGLSAIDNATAEENTAVIYRENGNHKLMVQHAKRALDLYRKSGDLYRECVCVKNLGEADYALGFKEAGLKHFHEAEERSLSLANPEDRFRIQYNLGVAFRRLNVPHRELTHLKKCFLILNEFPQIEIPDEQLLYMNNRINQLVKMNAGELGDE